MVFLSLWWKPVGFLFVKYLGVSDVFHWYLFYCGDRGVFFPASLVVPLTLVSRIGCFRGSVWIPRCLVVQWSMKLSIMPLSSKAFSTMDRVAHTVKGTFIFCMLWYKRFGSFALLQVVEVEQFKNPLVR